MKKLYLFLVIIISISFSLSAQSYRVAWTWKDISPNDGGGVESLIVGNGGLTETLANSCGQTNCQDLSGTTTVQFKPTRVFLQAGGSPTGTTTITYAANSECDSGSYDISTQNGGVPSRVTLRISPNINLSSTPSGGILGVCDDISLSASGGFSSSSYTWQYSYDNTTTGGSGPGGSGFTNWAEIPGKAGQTSIVLSSSDIPNVPVGKDFKIRLRFCSSSSQATTPRSFNYTNCSPNVLSVTPLNTTCSYSSDGRARFFFDRPLDTGEVLNGVSFNQPGTLGGTTGGVIIPLGYSITSLDANNSFLWPLTDTVPPGDYRLRYQSNATGTDETSPEFTIGSPPAFMFNVSASTIQCNDGTTDIVITASGGVSPYSYSIDNGTAIPFLNTTSTIINMVSTANYELRVFDNENCSEVD